jgi:2'-5' RNA ligase
MSRKELRLFCAIDLPDEIRQQASQRIAHLRAAFPNVRASWERPEKMHVTLKFLGEIPESKLVALSDACSVAAARVERFPLEVSEAGAFSKHRQPQVLWLGISDPTGRLRELHEALEQACATVGFPREDRPFHPHVTIARIRQKAGARELQLMHQEFPFQPNTFEVPELVLVKSDFGPGGSRYTHMSRHPLRTAQL